ncbi:hypothetical protein [Rhodoligotrophos defluvii]|uniref:hypothetical protein n=1 Tax=Rhodoligotrophos defluvii TaxID=2561934 RepID=UPI0010C95429|nr:hypothetical protein [Rhodoligotrophos defluvii]
MPVSPYLAGAIGLGIGGALGAVATGLTVWGIMSHNEDQHDSIWHNPDYSGAKTDTYFHSPAADYHHTS